LQAGTVTDVYGGTNSQGGYSTTFESQRIHISLSPDPYASTVSGPFVVHINFTIAPTNFNSSKITAINATVTVLNQIGSDGKNFDATFTPTSRGSIRQCILKHYHHHLLVGAYTLFMLHSDCVWYIVK
jgi:hypothetical protein